VRHVASVFPYDSYEERKVYPLRIERRLTTPSSGGRPTNLRSVNAQIEFLLRERLRRAGRLPGPGDGEATGPSGRPHTP
jgi:hypothetical protein